MCEILSWPWPRFLLRLPFATRLAICITSFSLGIIIHAFTSSALHYGSSIMIVPMVLYSWLFTKKGACICFFGYIAITILYNLVTIHSLLWSYETIFSLCNNILVMFALGSAMVSLRAMFEAEEEARHKAEEGEHQKALAYEQQRQLNQIKTQFIMNVNHELRTPLAAAYGYFELLQLMLEQNGKLEHTIHSTYLENALHYCEDLRAMVNNVLDTIDIWNAKKPLQLEKCSIAQILLSLIEDIDAFDREKYRIYLYISPELAVKANPQYLRNIFHQLLSNAIKFTPDPMPIVVYATADEEQGQEVCITVQDFGPGIPPEEIPELFNQFARLERDVAGNIRGTGQGLYICKQLVEAMQGRIWIESTGQPGRGCCFHITLPQAHQVVRKQIIPASHFSRDGQDETDNYAAVRRL